MRFEDLWYRRRVADLDGEAACRRYELSIEEFRTWESKVAPRSALSALAIDLRNSSSGHDVGKPSPGRSIQAPP